MSNLDNIIEAYGQKCAAERAEKASEKAALDARSERLLSLIDRLRAKEQQITFGGMGGAAQVFASWVNPYNHLRRAAEALYAGRENDVALAKIGHDPDHCHGWLNRAADARQMAIRLLAVRQVAA